ncbi:Nitroreductase [Granulicella pectinivorans]|uniref:Nitroreductase n=1 Tax=Granulicella pectinivorans TaxID=474950 RepID=A0A1I6MR07_9BACT|nr:nitroreductase family protein [Granulicella pectinivorans]SFS18145.1 Nitroreductase [Granulicella pectinivorans]
MLDILATIHNRHSMRGAFDLGRPVSPETQEKILQAAQWAPTPTNMQNFEMIVVNSADQLDAIGKIPADMSEQFLRETYALLSFTETELAAKRTGMLASSFPLAWTNPEAWNPEADARSQLTFLDRTIGETPLLMFVLYDGSRRAPGSDADTVGLISLGCVMENMWLACESLGLGFHVLTVVSDGAVEKQLRSLMHIPVQMKIAFACSIGYAAQQTAPDTRVRRLLKDFVHYNKFDARA